MFELHPQLEKDCIRVCELPMSLVLLMNDCQFPWLIQVPQIAGLTEIIQLDEEQQQTLWRESALLDRTLQALFQPDKLNLAALGNMVPQCHIHHIARFKHDLAWPGPVWGKVPSVPYEAMMLAKTLQRLRQYIADNSKKE